MATGLEVVYKCEKWAGSSRIHTRPQEVGRDLFHEETRREDPKERRCPGCEILRVGIRGGVGVDQFPSGRMRSDRVSEKAGLN